MQRRYFGTKELSQDRYAGDFMKVTEELIQHLASVDGVRLEVRVEITAVADDGFTDDKVRTVRENATQLKFEQSEFGEY